MPITDEGTFTVVLPHINERYGGIVHIKTRKVDSSNIDWIGWPVSGEQLMVVQFKGGSRYVYLDITRQRAMACARSASTGAYLAKHIKNKYETVKIR